MARSFRTSRSAPPPTVSAGLSTRVIHGGERTSHAEEVLAVVELIPRGKVMTYKDVAEYVGWGSGRTVGAVLSRHGHEVPWHRVLLSTGRPNPANPQEALRLLKKERTPMLPDGERVDLKRARWDGREK